MPWCGGGGAEKTMKLPPDSDGILRECEPTRTCSTVRIEHLNAHSQCVLRGRERARLHVLATLSPATNYYNKFSFFFVLFKVKYYVVMNSDKDELPKTKAKKKTERMNFVLGDLFPRTHAHRRSGADY